MEKAKALGMSALQSEEGRKATVQHDILIQVRFQPPPADRFRLFANTIQ
jgi:hypothetical protein